MTEMYSEKTYNAVKRKLAVRRVIVYTVFFSLLIASLVVLVIDVSDWHAYLHQDVDNSLSGHISAYPFAFILPLLAGAFGVFALGTVISPVAKYKKYLDNAFHGRCHQKQYLFKSLDEQTVLREGLNVWPVIFSEGSLSDEKDDRLLYLDVRAPRPECPAGTAMDITVHDRFLIDWKTSENAKA